jgi:hypothetical protein
MKTGHKSRTTAARSSSAGSPQPMSNAASPSETLVACGDACQKARTGCADEIRLSAYLRWERAGSPSGDGLQYWLEAEREFIPGK